MKTQRLNICLLLLIAFSAIPAFSNENTNKIDTQKKKNVNETKNTIIAFKDTEIRGTEILSKTQEMIRQILDNKDLDSGSLSLIAMWFAEYSNHPKIEDETKIRKEWFSRMSKGAKTLQEIKYKIECAKEEPHIPGNDQIVKNGEAKYAEILIPFKKLADTPDKIGSGSKKR